MKTLVLTIFLCLSFSNCSFTDSVGSGDDFANAKKKDETKIRTEFESNTENLTKLKKVGEVSQKRQKIPIIFEGIVVVSTKNKKLSSEGIWTLMEPVKEFRNEYKEIDLAPIGKTLDVDIMSCAGHILSAKVKKVGNYSWRGKFEPKLIGKDVFSRMRKCGTVYEDQIRTAVFAIAPIAPVREKQVLIKINKRKLFSSLPKENEDWIGTSEKFTKSRKKLSLENNDNWTDLDGDGKVDLVDVSFSNEKQSWGVIFLKFDGKWNVIGKILPA